MANEKQIIDDGQLSVPEKWSREEIEYCDDLYDCACVDIMKKQNEIIDCLEKIRRKMAPRKPVYPKNRSIHHSIVCPNCGGLVGDLDREYHFCPNCGTEIDWEELKRS